MTAERCSAVASRNPGESLEPMQQSPEPPMSAPPVPAARSKAQQMRRIVVQALMGVRALVRMARPVLRSAATFLLALVIVFEEWGWRPLSDLLGRTARWQPIARLESLIARLPPYAALVVFALPTTLLLPLKFLALLLIANGQVVLAGILFMAAKVVATAMIARLFVLTQPALMQIGWFAWAYERIMPWKQALVDRVHASWAWRVGRLWKERFKRRLGPALAPLRVRLVEAVRGLRARWQAQRSGSGS